MFKMKKKKTLLLGPDRATKEYPNGKGVSMIFPSRYVIDLMKNEDCKLHNTDNTEQVRNKCKLKKNKKEQPD